MKPFFTFYGGKWRAAPKYPAPAHNTIIEPFAGSAGYAVRHHAKRVILVERDAAVAATWRYLLNVTPIEILALPDVREHVDEVGDTVCEEARYLIGWWLNKGSATPKKSPGANMRRAGPSGPNSVNGWWGTKIRQRIAEQVDAIRHWRLIEGDYTRAPNIEATWFVDSPYIDAGKHYRHGSASIDYSALGDWCRSRRGQTIVCENTGAGWLPFRHLADIKASEARHGGKVSREAVWISE
jgi:hypothetical protein